MFGIFAKHTLNNTLIMILVKLTVGIHSERGFTRLSFKQHLSVKGAQLFYNLSTSVENYYVKRQEKRNYFWLIIDNQNFRKIKVKTYTE